jgi:hypothetical protein
VGDPIRSRIDHEHADADADAEETRRPVRARPPARWLSPPARE